MSIVSAKLTISGDVNGLFLCGSISKMIHTGQVLPLMIGQRKLISQPGFNDTPFIRRVQGCLAFGIFRKDPGEVVPDTLPSAVTHCQPEVRVLLSHHRHIQHRGF